MNVLFLNHKIENCGVYQYGKRVFDILAVDEEINYIYKEVDTYQEYHDLQKDVSYIIYNYHCATMPWLTHENIQKTVKNIGIPHESSAALFDIVCNIDPDQPETATSVSLPRPLFETIESLPMRSEVKEFIEYTDADTPIFGSFGFGFEFKGFDKIIKYVNEQYDTAIIKFVIPVAHYDPDVNRISAINSICHNVNIKPTIKLLISNSFFTTNEILQFLRSNTMNIFLYDKLEGRSISSTIDYALSVKRPLAISDSCMFKHIYSDEICLYKNTIRHCLQSEYLHPFLTKYSNKNMRAVFKKILPL